VNETATASLSTAAPAHLWRRLAANLYDGLLLLAIWMCGGLVVVLLRGEAVPPLTWWFEIYLIGLAFGYFGWSWVRGGQTLGMRAWQLRVQRQDGSSLLWDRAALRFLVGALMVGAISLGAWAARGDGAQQLVGAFAFGLGLLALGWTLIDRQRRGWHDLAANTVVVIAPRRP
jgi:uncharacterized RDD family membrane protein YckC